MKRRMKTRTGSKSSYLIARILVILGLISPVILPAKKKEKPAAEPFAIIAGTTFRPPGFSLPGVRVRLRPESDRPAAAGASQKAHEAITDNRGEFAIRVPAVSSRWSIDVFASGYRPQSKSVEIEGERRVELNFVLEPESGKK